jgi:hypothetical protein
MTPRSILRSSFRWSAAGVGLAAAGYAAYVGMTWAGYGRPSRPTADERDELLDRFMPVSDGCKPTADRISPGSFSR